MFLVLFVQIDELKSSLVQYVAEVELELELVLEEDVLELDCELLDCELLDWELRLVDHWSV